MAQSVLIPAIAPTLAVIDGIPTATSTDVAEHFGKRHDKVLEAIRNITAQLPTDRLHNFGETVTERPNPSGGEPIQSPAYRLTRDGFTLLAMGFTGKRALAFKLAYIDAFNRMEQRLQSPAQAVAPSQQQAAQQFFIGKRWLVTFRDGKEVVQEIDWNDCLLKYEELPKVIADSDNLVPSQLLADIAAACVQRLARQNANLTTACNALRQQERKHIGDQS